MRSGLRLACLIGALAGLLAVAAWGGEAGRQPSNSDGGRTTKELNSRLPRIHQGDSKDARTQGMPGKERVKGWSTTVVLRPPHYRHVYEVGYGYPPPAGYPYYPYYCYDRQPWGYAGPPVILMNDNYDVALVWNDLRQGFQWDPILPKRPGSNIPPPIINRAAQPPPRHEQPAATHEYGRAATAPAQSAGEQPKAVEPLGSWQKRGLVASVDYEAKKLAIVTSEGMFSVDAREATIVKAGYRATVARIGEGDAVKVWAEVTGLNKVKADRIEVISPKTDDAAPALRQVKTKGKIVYIDYPSFTFKIAADSGEARVLVDENTKITSAAGGERKAFQNLAVGQTVAVTGMGNLNCGYAASEVLLIDAGKTD